MPPRHTTLALALSVCAACASASAQTAAPTPAADQESVRVTVEEVRIHVSATDEAGRFDPTLAPSDLLVREDGAAQQVRGVYRLPADVLLLVDTGVGANPAKDFRLTREAAVALVSALRADDRVAVVQAGARAEVVRGWTSERGEVVAALRTRLLPGRRSALTAGVATSRALLRETPSRNRHLVLITDGLDASDSVERLSAALKELEGMEGSVHVISHTSMGRGGGPRRPATRPREGSALPHEGVVSLPKTRRPGDGAPDLRNINESKGGVTLDLERLFRGGPKLNAEELARRECEFAELTAETGGGLWLPLGAAEVLGHAAEVAREIDSQYVVTYRPARPPQ